MTRKKRITTLTTEVEALQSTVNDLSDRIYDLEYEKKKAVYLANPEKELLFIPTKEKVTFRAKQTIEVRTLTGELLFTREEYKDLPYPRTVYGLKYEKATGLLYKLKDTE